jgi:hypothetical protein
VVLWCRHCKWNYESFGQRERERWVRKREREREREREGC